MLEKIKIKNFQSHADTEISLDPGINVITGSSDIGKSSIFRAINWLRLNRPRGSSFVNHNANGKPVKVSLELDGTTITRIKSKSKNEYRLDKEAFKVVGSDVPEKITDFLNLNDISVQGQHDAYFLLQSSPGEVAKKLNKVAGFEIIDSVMKNVKSTITKNTSDCNYVDEHIKELDTDIKEYEHLDAIEKQLISIQTDINKYNTTNDTQMKVSNALENVKDTQEILSNLNEWLNVESLINPMLDDINTLADKSEKFENIVLTIETINELKKQVKVLKSKAQYEANVEQILTDMQEFNKQQEALKSLVLVLQKIKTYHLKIKNFDSKISKAENKMFKLLKDQKLCPLCGVKLTADGIAHIGCA